MKDGLKDSYKNAIVGVLSANEHVERAVLFGSRVKQTFRDGSDIDIALFGDSLTLIDNVRLNGSLDELTVPQRVDLVIYHKIDNPSLRRHILQDGIELYKKGK